MKKIIFVIIFFLFSILSRAEGFGVHVGGQIGYQTTHLSASRADIDASIANHLILGGFGRLVINDFVIQPEIMLFKTAQIFSLEGTDSTHLNVSLETKQQSLAFPMMGGYQFYDSPLIKARATAGLVLYYVVDDANSNNYNNQSLDIEPNKWTFGGAFNVGVDVLMFTLDLTYTFGLTNILEREYVEIGGHHYVMDNTRQNMFSVTVGIKLFNYEYNSR